MGISPRKKQNRNWLFYQKNSYSKREFTEAFWFVSNKKKMLVKEKKK